MSARFGRCVRKSRKAFTQKEDDLLRRIVEEVGEFDWNEVAKRMPNRNARQCRDRWRGYLQPNLTVAPWTVDEDQLVLNKYAEVGPKWSFIRQFLPERSETAIKARWKAIVGENRGVLLPTHLPMGSGYQVPMHRPPFMLEPPVMVPCHVVMPPVAEPAMDRARRSPSIESSPETSAGERETLNTPQDLEAFFNSLSRTSLRNRTK